MLSIELIDAGLILAQQGGDDASVLSMAPGVAMLEENATLTGEAAASRLRLQPLLAQTNFWRGLSTEPLVRPSRLVRTTADTAFAQASALLEPYKSDAEGVLLAVPAGYTREQLGLLLGVINETGVNVAGVVDAALAACSLEAAPARVLHLDLELHQASLTALDYVGTGLKRNRYEIAPRHGLLALQQTWVQMIAEAFVINTRFDPLHDAASEQRLLNQLPQWLDQLVDNETLTLSLQLGERPLEIELTREHFVTAAQAHYAELVKLVQDARVAGLPIELRVSQRVAAMPGLLQCFATLRDCTVRALPRGAAALGALTHRTTIQRSPESLALVYQLPVARADGNAVTEHESTPSHLRPTHVLFQGRAWRVSEAPLAIGWSPPPGRSLVLPSAAPGVSRAHCMLVRRNGSVVVEDRSTYGSYVNEERVVGHSVLTVGDRLRLGTPGVTLDMIQLVQDDGAPQD
ncbi:FHA domain-containing protein [Povalibacter sp.]|uniref:FHA domain-containing protein n=1 Tax=Povalibacter sp. TaxID=1962978 RepID=UPI002F408C13